MLGLAIALLFVIVAYPMLLLVLAAFGIPGPPTVEHLARVATRAQNFDSLVNTLQLAFGTGLLSIAFGVPLAWATARSDMPLRRSVHALVALSYITPPYLTALAYIILLGPDAGHFNRLLRWLLGLEAAPFNIFSMGGLSSSSASTSSPSPTSSPIRLCNRSTLRSRSRHRCWVPAAGR